MSESSSAFWTTVYRPPSYDFCSGIVDSGLLTSSDKGFPCHGEVRNPSRPHHDPPLVCGECEHGCVVEATVVKEFEDATGVGGRCGKGELKMRCICK